MLDVARFERSLLASGYNPDTIDRAARVARMYLASCNGHDPAAVSTVEAFLANAWSRQVSKVTLLNYHRDLKMLFTWALSKGIVTANPVDKIPRPKPSLYERERDTAFLPYTEDEWETLIDANPPWWQGWIGLRNRALFRIFWDTPARVSAVCRLDLADIDWDILELRFLDKNGARYGSPITARTAEALDDYLAVRRAPMEDDETALFIDRHGGRVTRHGLEQMFTKTARRAQFTKPLTPHLCKHNFAARMRIWGADERRTAALMAHASLAVNRGYARAVAQTEAKAWYRTQMALHGLTNTYTRR